MKILIIANPTSQIDCRCPTIKFDRDNDRWIFPRRDVGGTYEIIDEINVLNTHVRKMSAKFLELYKKINAKTMDISKIPLKILNLSNEQVAKLYKEVLNEKLIELLDPVYQLFNITKKIADEVNNASTYSLLQYKKFGKYIKDHTEYEKLWFENAFGDLFEETENLIESIWKTDKKICGQYSFSAGFQIANQLYDDYLECASAEINNTDTGINRFLNDMTTFEDEIEKGLYKPAKKCIELRLKNDPVECLTNLTRIDLGKMINKEEVRAEAKRARVDSVKRVNDCASIATKKSLDGIKKVYQQLLLCLESKKGKRFTTIKGINRISLFLFEDGPQKTCPLAEPCKKCGM
uniref:CSON001753 protein n=1 Tax=Culicoides sonorensis TaxID=179676 RepID=A0A336LR94_CULSO